MEREENHSVHEDLSGFIASFEQLRFMDLLCSHKVHYADFVNETSGDY